MTHCPTCKEYLYRSNRTPHTCPPQWRVWIDEDDTYSEQEAHTVYASNASMAAEKFAEWEDRKGEFDIARRGYVDCFVREVATGNLYQVEVQAETVIEYTAREPRAVKSTA